ncbi:MAG: iron-sulfur cluster assembly scaffold protein [Candidatus Berkelbacteria bacterium]
MEEYSEAVLDHFYNPRNVGEIEDADGVGEVGNMKCGDVMHIYIKVAEKDGKEIIEDVKFKTLGCAAAIATSSMMTELVKGKTLEEAAKVSKDDINVALGILPKQKYHCSMLSADGIQRAIADYRSKKEHKDE